MLVVHANWTDGALRMWAESLDAYQRAADEDGRTPKALAARADDAAPAPPGDDAGAVALVEPAPRHPFALDGIELERALSETRGVSLADGVCTMRLRLPTDSIGSARPQPSDRLAGMIAARDRGREPRLGVFDVPGLALPGDQAIAIMLALESSGSGREIEFGHSLRYWMGVCRFVLELVVDQRFIPTLLQSRGADLRAAWQPWLHDESTLQRVGALLSGMPPVVRAVVDDHRGRPWSILDEALRVLTDATVRRALIAEDFIEAVEDRDAGEDPHVAWLAGLLGEGDGVDPPADSGIEMLRDVARWISALDDTGRDRPVRLCFSLSEPPEEELDGGRLTPDDDVRWRLSLHLMGTGEEPVMIDAERIWRDPAAARLVGGGQVRDPEELLLSELGRAARMAPILDAALSQAEPTGIDLTTAQAYTFLTEYREVLEESGFAVIVPAWWGRPSARLGARLQVEAPSMDSITAEAGSGGAAGRSLLGLNSLIQYRWQLAVGDQPLTMDEFRELAQHARGGSLLRLRGRWVEIEPKQIAEAAKFFESHPGGEMTLLEAVQLAHGAGADRPGLPVFGMDATGWVADLMGASSDEARMPRVAQPTGFQGKLRPYQEVGLSWLAFLDRFGLGACLADDMGLGKTIQLIALLQAERERGDGARLGPTLLIVPTSVIANWQRELARFSPELTVHIHHGPDRPVGDRLIEIAGKHDVLITTYTLISRDQETLVRMPWHRVVLDEAQYIKNPPTKQTATIRALKTARRVSLTGTPVENRLSELWSIMEFCNPGYLGQPGEFRRRFSVPIERHRDQHRAEQLRRLVRPFVLRRLKTDPTVIDDLPPCVVTKEYATLTGEQAALYEEAVGNMLGRVGKAEGIQRRGLVLATLVKLKQICNHPAQVKKNGEGTRPVEADRAGDGLLSARSGKCRRLIQMLEEVLATGDKALLFTQFRRMGHLLESMLRHDLDTEVLFLHGGTPPKRRQQMIDRFQDPDGGVPIFILSLKAGGIGVNLTAANHVFHFDRWWNPAVENQATDRAFRIGQTRTVHVHKFVCLGTLEERIDQMIEQKTELAQNIIGAGEDWLTELSTGQLRDLLMLRDSAMDVEGES
ncbi:MAG: DEAD/DEAH box helicase [Planctomycetota bacterium]|nr:DEAD/DEAH box helicase [Planctomycetota bacterium]